MELEFTQARIEDEVLAQKYEAECNKFRPLLINVFGNDDSDRSVRRFVGLVSLYVSTVWMNALLHHMIPLGDASKVTPAMLNYLSSLLDVDGESLKKLSAQATKFIMSNTTAIPSGAVSLINATIQQYGNESVTAIVEKISKLWIVTRMSEELDHYSKIYDQQNQESLTESVSNRSNIVSDERYRDDMFRDIQDSINAVVVAVERSGMAGNRECDHIRDIMINVWRELSECKDYVGELNTKGKDDSNSIDFQHYEGVLFDAVINGERIHYLKALFETTSEGIKLIIVYHDGHFDEIKGYEAYVLRDYYARYIRVDGPKVAMFKTLKASGRINDVDLLRD